MKKSTKWNIVVCAIVFGLISGLFLVINANAVLKARVRRVEESNIHLQSELEMAHRTDSLIVEFVRKELVNGGDLNTLLDNLEETIVSSR